MANLSLLQEQLIGKAVVKRAKHGIHFDNGDGQVLANFVGKPCHWQDTDGLWKPIDTRLLLGADGYYGCPHSPVRVHADGYVKVDGSDYTQYTPLLGAPVGLVDNDRIVREFAGGRQYIYVTEDGFRQEIILDAKPSLKLADAKKLLAVEYGALPLKYVATLLTATDATGKTYTYTTTSEMIAWLQKAVYPVTIDPDFAGSTADGHVYGQDADYATARSTSGAESLSSSTVKVGQTTTYQVYRGYFMFDTSAIGAGSTVTQVNLKLTVETNSSTTDFVPLVVKYAGGATREARFDNLLNNDLDDGNFGSTGTGTWSANTQKTSGNLSTAWVNKTGTTYYGVVSEEDRNNSAPTASELIEWHSASASTESYRPVLTVLYSAGGALLRVNMNGNMQSLTGGFHG